MGMTTPWMDLVASLVPNSEAKIIPHARHFAMIEAAPAVIDQIQAFATHIGILSGGSGSLRLALCYHRFGRDPDIRRSAGEIRLQRWSVRP
jgi:hypothetical protein